jgi:hypothetical protein
MNFAVAVSDFLGKLFFGVFENFVWFMFGGFGRDQPNVVLLL